MDLTSESRHPAWQGALTAGVWGKWFGILYFSNFLAPNYNLHSFRPHPAQFFCLKMYTFYKTHWTMPNNGTLLKKIITDLQNV